MKCNQKEDDHACICCAHDKSWQVNLVDILHWWISMNVNPCGSLQNPLLFFFFLDCLCCSLKKPWQWKVKDVNSPWAIWTRMAIFMDVMDRMHHFIYLSALLSTQTAEAYCPAWTPSLRPARLIGANTISKHGARCRGKIHISLVLILNQQTAESHLFLTPRGLCHSRRVYS